MGPIIGCHPVPRLQLVLSFGHGEIIDVVKAVKQLKEIVFPGLNDTYKETIMAISTKEALGAANKTFLFFQFPTVSLL